MIDFATKLKGMRNLKGWSQDELAERLNMTRSAIGNWELGIRTPSYENLEAIADLFNYPIAYFIGELTPMEIEIINAYRRMSPEGKSIIHSAMGIKGDAEYAEELPLLISKEG